MTVEGPRPRPRFRQTLRFTIVSVFTALLVGTVFAVIVTGHRQATRTQREMTDVLFQRVGHVVGQRTEAFLAPARGLVEVHARQFEAGAFEVDPERPGLAMDSFARTLQLFPDFTNFYFVFPSGELVGAERLDDERTVLWHIVEGGPEARSISRTVVDSKGAVLETSLEQNPDVSVAEHDWFIWIREGDDSVWTPPYLFQASRPILGMTARRAVHTPEGDLAGVFGIDLDLASLSAFVDKLGLSDTGHVMIVNADEQMMAWSGYDKWHAENPGADQLPLADDVGVPWVRSALGGIGSEGGHVEVMHGGELWLVLATPLTHIPGARWHVVVAAPMEEFVGPLWQTNQRIMVGSMLALLLGLVAVAWVARRISRPIVELSARTQRVADLDLGHEEPIRSRIWEVQLLSDAVEGMKVGLSAFLRYVPDKLVRQVIESGEEVKVGGREEEVTLFFSDVQGFTTLSEGMDPQTLTAVLSEYLEVVTSTIQEHGGTVDKFIGDGVMAFWGAPLPDPEHALHASKAAVVCQQRLDELNTSWEQRGLQPLHTRIGLHTGQAVVGNVGTSDRLNYTAMGDSVNTAARLEGANKQFGTRILISDATRARLDDGFELRPLGEVELKGKTVAKTVFELVGVSPDA